MRKRVNPAESSQRSNPSRREFLRRAGLLAGGLALLGPTGLFRSGTAGAVIADSRAYPPGKYALALDGVVSGWIQSADGGNARADVVTEGPGQTFFAKKHIGQLKYEPIVVEFGAGMGKGFYDWVRASLNMNYQRKNGAIIAADYELKEKTHMDFFNALITEVAFPALDAASKDTAHLTVKLAPEYTRMAKGSGAAVPVDKASQQKIFTPKNFRLKILNLEQACARVNRIEALTIKQKTVESAIGDARDYQKEPGKLEFPNLVFTLPEADAGPFYAWYEDFVLKGNNADQLERPGVLELLAADQTVLFTLTFYNLGIFNFAPMKEDVGEDAIRRVKIEMYCERIDFQAGPITAAAPPAAPGQPLPPGIVPKIPVIPNPIR